MSRKTCCSELDLDVKRRAYYIWNELGCPSGMNESIWFLAKKDILEEVGLVSDEKSKLPLILKIVGVVLLFIAIWAPFMKCENPGIIWIPWCLSGLLCEAIGFAMAEE